MDAGHLSKEARIVSAILETNPEAYFFFDFDFKNISAIARIIPIAISP